MLDYVFHKLGIDSPSVDHPVVMTETLCNPHYSRARACQLLLPRRAPPTSILILSPGLSPEQSCRSSSLNRTARRRSRTASTRSSPSTPTALPPQIHPIRSPRTGSSYLHQPQARMSSRFSAAAASSRAQRSASSPRRETGAAAADQSASTQTQLGQLAGRRVHAQAHATQVPHLPWPVV